MKWYYHLICIFFFYVTAFAQSPQSINYQGFVRDLSKTPVENKNIRPLLSTQPIFTVFYFTEIQSVKAIFHGLLGVRAGRGTPTSGSFSSIPWFLSEKRLEAEVSPNGINHFEFPGQSEALANIPYALHSESASEANMAGSIEKSEKLSKSN